MESPRFKISPLSVLRVAPFMAVRDIRYYLNGIRVERASIGGCFIVACDGHTLAVDHDKDAVLEGADSVIFAVKPALLVACRKTLRRPWIHKVQMHVLLQDGRVRVAPDFEQVCNDAELYVQSGRSIIEGTYPAWRKVVPDFDKLKLGFAEPFNARLMERFAEAGEYGGSRITGIKCWQAAPNGAVVVQMLGIPSMLGLLMTMRDTVPTDFNLYKSGLAEAKTEQAEQTAEATA